MNKKGPKPKDKGLPKKVEGKCTPPSGLSPFALAEFIGVCEALESQGTLNSTDSRIIAQYVDAYEFHDRLKKQVASEELSSVSTNGRGFTHPLVPQLLTAKAQLRQFLSELCLTPKSRGKTEEQVSVDPKWDF